MVENLDQCCLDLTRDRLSCCGFSRLLLGRYPILLGYQPWRLFYLGFLLSIMLVRPSILNQFQFMFMYVKDQIIAYFSF